MLVWASPTPAAQDRLEVTRRAVGASPLSSAAVPACSAAILSMVMCGTGAGWERDDDEPSMTADEWLELTRGPGPAGMPPCFAILPVRRPPRRYRSPGAIEVEPMTPRPAAVPRRLRRAPLPGVCLCVRLPAGRFRRRRRWAGAIPVTVVTLRQPIQPGAGLPGRTATFRVAEYDPQVRQDRRAARLFDEGSLVKANRALYQLDDATYRCGRGCRASHSGAGQANLEEAAPPARGSFGKLVKTDLVARRTTMPSQRCIEPRPTRPVGSRAASAWVALAQARITAPIGGRIG